MPQPRNTRLNRLRRSTGYFHPNRYDSIRRVRDIPSNTFYGRNLRTLGYKYGRYAPGFAAAGAAAYQFAAPKNLQQLMVQLKTAKSLIGNYWNPGPKRSSSTSRKSRRTIVVQHNPPSQNQRQKSSVRRRGGL